MRNFYHFTQWRITFEPSDGFAWNFQGHPYSSQVIFGQVVWHRWLAGTGPGLENGHFCQIYLLRGFWVWGVVSYLFGIGRTKQRVCWERNFEFQPLAGNNGAARQGWPAGQRKFWISGFFNKSDPHWNQILRHFCDMQLFDSGPSWGPAGLPRAGMAKK